MGPSPESPARDQQAAFISDILRVSLRCMAEGGPIDSPTGAPAHQGFLSKRSDWLRVWRTRFFHWRSIHFTRFFTLPFFSITSSALSLKLFEYFFYSN